MTLLAPTSAHPVPHAVASGLPAATASQLQSNGVEPGRDLAVDLLRVAALGIVVLGHWLIAVIQWQGGQLETQNLLDALPAVQWATWLFQPMPLFFAVGGWAAARSWMSRSAGQTKSRWVQGRLQRLVIPAGTYAVVSLAVTAGIVAVMGADATPVGGLLGMHLWFLAVYVPITAAMPLVCELVERFGWRVPLILGTAVVAVDLARFIGQIPGIGWANFAFVWLMFSALGAVVANRPPRPARLLPFTIGALGVLVFIVASGWYSHSMVGVGDRSNNTPPTVALGLFGLAQIGLAGMAIPSLRRWIARHHRAPGVITSIGSVGMHLYLWHLYAVVIAVAVMRGGFGNLDPLSSEWWATRPLWWGVLACVSAPIVWMALQIDIRRFRTRNPGTVGTATRTVLATVMATIGFTVLALAGTTPMPTTLLAAGALLASQTIAAGRQGCIHASQVEAGSPRTPSEPSRPGPLATCNRSTEVRP